MVQRLTPRSAGRVESSTHFAWGGVIPDVLMLPRPKLRSPGATRHALLATSFLLLLLLTSAAAMAAEPTATPPVNSADQSAQAPAGNGTWFLWVTPSGNPVYWDSTHWQASLYDQMILAFSSPTDNPVYSMDSASTSWGGPALSASHHYTFEEEDFGLSPPTSLSPSGLLSSGSNLTLSWDAVTDADGYNVSVDDWYTQTNVLSTSVTDNSVPLPALTDNQGYIASVMAYSTTLGTSDWTSVNIDVCSYNAAPTGTPVFSAPAALWPSGSPHIGLDVTFEWSRVATAARYWLAVCDWQVSNLQVTSWPLVYSETVLDPGSGTVSCGPVTLQEGHVYCAYVLSSNPAGPGPYSAPLYLGVSTATGPPPATSFTLPPQQTLNYSSIPYYTPKIDTTNVVFEWSQTAKTLGYNFMLVEVDPEYNFLGLWWIADDGTSNPAQFNLPQGMTLKDGCRYEMGVAGYNAWGLGAWTVVDFVPGDPPPVTGPTLATTITDPVGTTPVGANDIYDRRPTFSVFQVPRTTQYVWYINDSSQNWATTWFEVPATPGPQSSYTLT